MTLRNQLTFLVLSVSQDVRSRHSVPSERNICDSKYSFFSIALNLSHPHFLEVSSLISSPIKMNLLFQFL